MAVAAPLAPLPRSEAGDVRFVSQGELLAATETLDEQGWLIAKPAAPCAAHRSRLAHLFEEAVELGLQQRQAPPAGVAASSDLDGSLSDQLYRARAVGAKGICVYVPPLLRITGAAGALDAEDSAILRWWMTSTTERPVRLLIHAKNRALGVYGPPLLLQTLLEAGTDAWRSAPAPCTDRLEASTREAPASESADEAAVTPAPTPASEADDTRAGSLHEPIRAEAADSDHASGSTPVALYPEAAERWQDWQRELERARGPKPLSVVERLFVSAYLPLLEARLSGEAPSSAQDTLDAWAASFEHSYSEAFEALRWRSQRPTMVLDMPDLALRIARLHGARSVQLILVDSMRFDLGQRINNHLGLLLSRHAALTEQLLLWAALPATTSVQLDLLGRGPDGLRELDLGNVGEVTVARGRAASTLRRIKTTGRELLKLDLVEARLSEPGAPCLERLSTLAVDCSQSLAQHVLRLPPRTLVVVFGDHGFVFDSIDGGTSAARHGGARPEEVLVPAFAWLVGAAH